MENEKKGEGRRMKKGEGDRSGRGGGCLHLITGLFPSYGQVYATAARLVPCNALCNVLAIV